MEEPDGNSSLSGFSPEAVIASHTVVGWSASSWEKQPLQTPIFVFADFRGVNPPIASDFKLPAVPHGTPQTPDSSTVSLQHLPGPHLPLEGGQPGSWLQHKRARRVCSPGWLPARFFRGRWLRGHPTETCGAPSVPETWPSCLPGLQLWALPLQ